MHLQPNRNYLSNDEVQTPPVLARRLVAHFQPRGRILEPCAGKGNFLRALRAHAARGQHAKRGDSRIDWCEINRGRDFLTWREPVDWVVTNPPWSQFRAFLQHAMSLAEEVVFVVTVNHLWTRARIQDMAAADFGLREIVLLDMPSTFPPLGFQLGAVHLARGWAGPITLTDWTTGAVKQRNPVDSERPARKASTRWSPGEIAAFRAFREREAQRAA